MRLRYIVSYQYASYRTHHPKQHHIIRTRMDRTGRSWGLKQKLKARPDRFGGGIRSTRLAPLSNRSRVRPKPHQSTPNNATHAPAAVVRKARARPETVHQRGHGPCQSLSNWGHRCTSRRHNLRADPPAPLLPLHNSIRRYRFSRPAVRGALIDRSGCISDDEEDGGSFSSSNGSGDPGRARPAAHGRPRV